MAKAVRGSDGLTERDRFWLRHLERQRSGSADSKTYAAREGLSVHALYQARKHLVACGAWPALSRRRRGEHRRATRTTVPAFTRVALGAAPLRTEALPACRPRLASGAVIEWRETPAAAQLAALLGAAAPAR
jgi:hypothetical protein